MFATSGDIQVKILSKCLKSINCCHC